MFLRGRRRRRRQGSRTSSLRWSLPLVDTGSQSLGRSRSRKCLFCWSLARRPSSHSVLRGNFGVRDSH
eukprot:15458851-Alexandrium_andersonii.AAC.1